MRKYHSWRCPYPNGLLSAVGYHPTVGIWGWVRPLAGEWQPYLLYESLSTFCLPQRCCCFLRVAKNHTTVVAFLSRASLHLQDTLYHAPVPHRQGMRATDFRVQKENSPLKCLLGATHFSGILLVCLSTQQTLKQLPFGLQQAFILLQIRNSHLLSVAPYNQNFSQNTQRPPRTASTF